MTIGFDGGDLDNDDDDDDDDDDEKKDCVDLDNGHDNYDQGGRVGSGSVELGWRDLRPGTVGKWEDTGSRWVCNVICHLPHFHSHFQLSLSLSVVAFTFSFHFHFHLQFSLSRSVATVSQ